jgi:hypothetical protein
MLKVAVGQSNNPDSERAIDKAQVQSRKQQNSQSKRNLLMRLVVATRLDCYGDRWIDDGLER